MKPTFDKVFKKSSLSPVEGCGGIWCVEVKRTSGQIQVRDSKDPTSTLDFSENEWSAFIGGVKNGEFDI